MQVMYAYRRTSSKIKNTEFSVEEIHEIPRFSIDEIDGTVDLSTFNHICPPQK
jgi:DNA polymerase/3'-5' exonuclease PolX